MYFNRTLATTIILATLGQLAAADPVELTPVGFVQLTAEHHDGDDSVAFGADRVFIGGRFKSGQASGGAVLDLNVNNFGDRPPGTFANLVKDLYVGWHFDQGWRLRGGQFKSPVGMDFNSSGSGLDITKRGMEKGLVLERALGIMASADAIGEHFGIDFGVFNPAGRSAATKHTAAQRGDDNAAAVRFRFDHQNWHAEAAYGVSSDAGGAGTRNYRVVDLGASYRADALTLKAEYIKGENVFGLAVNEETVWYIHAGYRPTPRWEVVTRHYRGSSHRATLNTNLTNTYIGASFWPFAKHVRVQLNYVIAGADESAYTGTRGFRGDALLLQLQLAL